MKRLLVFVFAIGSWGVVVKNTEGCTDPNAINSDPSCYRLWQLPIYSCWLLGKEFLGVQTVTTCHAKL